MPLSPSGTPGPAAPFLDLSPGIAGLCVSSWRVPSRYPGFSAQRRGENEPHLSGQRAAEQGGAERTAARGLGALHPPGVGLARPSPRLRPGLRLLSRPSFQPGLPDWRGGAQGRVRVGGKAGREGCSEQRTDGRVCVFAETTGQAPSPRGLFGAAIERVERTKG